MNEELDLDLNLVPGFLEAYPFPGNRPISVFPHLHFILTEAISTDSGV